MYVISVVLDRPLRQSYNYLSTQLLELGARVIVNFNRQEQIGFVTQAIPQDEFTLMPINKLKPILASSTSEFNIPADIWQLCNFAANYYHHPFGTSLFCALPTLLRKTTPLPQQLISEVKYYQAISANKGKRELRPQQQFLWQQLEHNSLNLPQMQTILGENPRPLIKRWLAQDKLKQVVAPQPSLIASTTIVLNDEQQYVITQFSQYFGQFHLGLLYGITGSGKTEIFLHLIHQVLRQNKQILILVPEINLTPQLAKRFSQRFPHAQIRLLNSEISDKSRLETWLGAKEGSYQIILGTRLSVFTPFKQLGLIIVDEEHDDSFKQNDGLRYHARDLAIWRAKQLNLPILLASATPSIETLYNYKRGRASLYKLTQRAINLAQLPQINIINLQHYPANHAGISQVALDKLSQCLQRQELAMIFINRRGYAPVITCYECGWVSNCRYCSSNMVYHHEHNQLKCHHCSYQIQVPPFCPQCKNQYLHTIGHGTQKLEQFISQYFPEAKIRRIDRDTTSHKQDWQDIYQQIEQQQLDILIGTQMLAKGHDFANLTLVIGLNLDNALFSYDFRSTEQMFSTLTQVSGRAGRATKAGEVILQTNYPDHPVYQFLKQHDFNGFINYTMYQRKQHQLPPFVYYALVRFSALDEEKLKQTMHEVYQQAKQLITDTSITIFAPVPAVLFKLHKRFRGQILISSTKRNLLHQYLQQIEIIISQINSITIALDVDPFDM
ncbi:MAG: hypothetical protein RLZZ293_1432 [Pseudomonadota bacterium]|jgi:primosomal protein N' (replication factor Y)